MERQLHWHSTYIYFNNELVDNLDKIKSSNKRKFSIDIIFIIERKYERGYRAGRREAEAKDETSFSDDDLEELIKKHGLKIVDKRGVFYTLADKGRSIGTGFALSKGKVIRIWINLKMEDTGFPDVEYYGKAFDSVRNFYRELKDSV